MDSDLESLTNDEVAGAAATVVLLRDGERGVEVLLAERPRDRGSFAGAWVFPGGAVDDADALGGSIDTEDAARRAAVRETLEEIGLQLDRYDLVPFSHWTPPKNSPKQLRTTFFAVRVPDGEITPAPDEVMAVEWLRPVDALDRHAAGAMTLWPPTWVTLHGLQRARIRRRGARRAPQRRREAVRRARQRRRLARSSGRRTTSYETELHRQENHPAVADEGPDAEGNQHRLVMDRLPWIYVNTMGAGF